MNGKNRITSQHRRCPKGYSAKQGKLTCSVYKGRKKFAVVPNRAEAVSTAWTDFYYHKSRPRNLKDHDEMRQTVSDVRIARI